MFISRRKYEHDLKEAYEKGRYEAEDRSYRERSFERIWEKLGNIESKVRKLEGKQEPAEAITEGCPLD